MTTDLTPIPNTETRSAMAERVRNEATQLAKRRVPIVQQPDNETLSDTLRAEPDDDGWVAAHATFTKGLAHDRYGRVKQADLQGLVKAINQDANGTHYAASPFPTTYTTGKPAEFNAALYDPVGTPHHAYSRPAHMKPRGWESPLAGHTLDLQGADADQLSMAPAPELGSPELTAEMAEVYCAAVIRDIAFANWASDPKVTTITADLAALPYFTDPADDTSPGGRRRLARLKNHTALSVDTLFRGSTPGAKTGPYISQFLYLGSEPRKTGEVDFTQLTQGGPKDAPGGAIGLPEMHDLAATGSAGPIPTDTTAGLIRYGIQAISQRFTPHDAHVDHMIEWQTWLDVQNGANRKDDLDIWHRNGEESRFIATPRDLATYVHFDALYQAYLNATLLLLGAKVPTDTGLPEGGKGTRNAFATFGDPHILSLVCEVATRALKAVRRQKYNIHLRSRPEALAAALSLAWTGTDENLTALGHQSKALQQMATALGGADGILQTVAEHNANAQGFWDSHNWPEDHGPLGSKDFNALLPMAFPEGSPMHPAYGAGHATVAGACITIVKAFFEMYQGVPDRGFSIYDTLGITKPKRDLYHNRFPAELFGVESPLTVTHDAWKGMTEDERARVPFPTAVLPDPDSAHTTLKQISENLTIQQELDKLAANIAIGRNFAGVHYYSDYFDSLRMGERLAVSILQEQMLTYREPVSMRFTSFDGDYVMVVGTGGSADQDDTATLVWTPDGVGGTRTAFQEWWSRHNG
ncbi:MAG: hypothetical protein N4A53_02090 [Pelagimonas sp.]|jgi:hypothetical protein|nr:hypothetical protein [Pelagimonas sp.]